MLDDFIECLKTLREADITHVTPERLEPRPLGAKAVAFSIVAPINAGCVCGTQSVPSSPPPCDPNDTSEAQGARLGSSAEDGMGLVQVKMRS
jgi:hypothetical protein